MSTVFKNEKGSALIYILIAVALLAALTVSLMEPSSQQTQSQNTANLVSELSGQVSTITTAISECVLSYPDQDSELTTTQQKNTPYPINPKDPYYTSQSATPAVDTVSTVAKIRCPGNPGGTGATNQNHSRIFGGSSGKFMPAIPSLFNDWTYYNGADGVYIMTASDKTDAFIVSSLAKLDAKYSSCESEVINRLSSGALNITSDIPPGDSAVRTCAAGNICFRYWIILKSTAIHQDAGCP